jgi:hypothetical protein
MDAFDGSQSWPQHSKRALQVAIVTIIALLILVLVDVASLFNTNGTLQQKDCYGTKTISRKEFTLSMERNVNAVSAFDSLVQQAQDRAFAVPANPPRNTLNLTTWTKGSGGLTDPDRLLLAEIYGNASSVFEFGLGESTYIASHVGVPRYAGIDSDAIWVSNARDAVHPHFRFYLGDIGKTGAWGMPLDPTLSKSVLDYQIAPLLAEPLPFDVYMVDGRMRFACLMVSFLHASSRGASWNDTIVLNHDCGDTIESNKLLNSGSRVIYKAADHLLDLVSHSGGLLCVYRRKETTTDAQLLELWQTHYTAWNR